MDRAGEQDEVLTCRRLLPSWLNQAACVATRECQILGSILGEWLLEMAVSMQPRQRAKARGACPSVQSGLRLFCLLCKPGLFF